MLGALGGMSGWGEFGWKFIPKAERVCRQCGKQIKRMDDVFETRHVFPSNKIQLLCNACRPAPIQTHPRS